MSGIEVAGIALAVFPVLVDGLNHVVSGIETIKRWVSVVGFLSLPPLIYSLKAIDEFPAI